MVGDMETGEVTESIGDMPALEHSPALGKWAEAMAQAQSEIENAKADSENPHFGSTYADLASIIAAVRAPLAKAGIARHQALFTRNGEVGVRTSLIHVSGEWMASTVWCPFEGTPQKLGSVVTYLRRYSLAAAVGLAQEDDDANAAEGARPKARRSITKPEIAPPSGPALEPKTQARIKILQKELGIPDDEWRGKLQQYYEVSSSADLSAEEAEDLIGRLEARKSAVATHGASGAAKSSQQT